MNDQKLKIAFVIDDIQTITKSTQYLIAECFSRGHEVTYLYPKNFTIRSNEAYGFLHKITTKDQKHEAEAELLPLRSLDAIFIRIDFSVDVQNLACFLDVIADDVFIMNGVKGLRKASNKLYMTSFYSPGEPAIIPETYVSKNKEILKKTIAESKRKYWILKPFRGTRGRGVIVLTKDSMKNVSSLLDFYIGSEEDERIPKNYIILQEYLPKAEKGDKRILLLNGEILGAMKRVPAEDDHRSNLCAGGRAIVTRIFDHERAICEGIKEQLLRDELYFVGIDIVGDKLIEVNVLSPGGLSKINELYDVQLESKVISFIEQKVRSRQ